MYIYFILFQIEEWDTSELIGEVILAPLVRGGR